MNFHARLIRLLPALAVATPVSGQDLVAPLAAPPSGYLTTPSPFLPTAGEALDGLELGIGTSFIYDSNVFQAPGTLAAPVVDDLIFSVSPSIAYQTQGSTWILGGHAGFDYRGYFDNSTLSGFDYDAGAHFAYQGNPLTVTGAVDYSFTQGVNRYFGGANVETHNFTTSLGASYRWSAKTSFDARYSYRSSEPDQAAFGTTETSAFDVAALWKATPLITVGPGIAWTYSDGDRQVDRQTLGPILRLKYDLTTKVALDGTFGMDFVDYGGGGGSDTTFSTSLGVAYRASALWGMNLSVFSGTSADGALPGAYRETTSVRVGYYRKIRRVALGLGASYETSDYTNPTGGAVAGGQSRDFVSLDASLGMAVFRDRVQAATFFAWREESGNPAREWDGYQLGVSLSSKF